MEAVPANRLHAFDALRACALLLGIAYHAASSFDPMTYDTPVFDRSGYAGFAYFTFVCHIFRMPVFFLLAGFFARLIYQRRGTWGFLKQRFTRIGIPLVLFWFLLTPLVIHAWYWGLLRAEELTLGVNALDLTLEVFHGMLEKPLHLQLLHLWFLYHLLIFYVIFIAAHELIHHVLDRNGQARRLIAGALERLLRSRWNVLILAVPAAALFRHAPMDGVNHGNLSPDLLASSLYLVIFTTGWLLHRQAGLLAVIQRRWAPKLALALALTIPLFGLMVKYDRYDFYLMLKPDQSLDINALAGRLQEQLGTPGENPGKRIWRLLPAHQQLMLADRPVSSMEARGAVVRILNRIQAKRDFYHPEDFEHIPLSIDSLQILGKNREAWSEEEVITLNRHLLGAAFPGVIPPIEPPPPVFGMIKWAHGFLYALAMWLFVFGTVGLFLSVFNEGNAIWRYIADSSYWLYLIHLPLVYNLQVAMAPLELHWSLKYPLLLAVAFALMLLSYHTLVRPTALGVLLNGRRYPVPWQRTAPMVATDRSSTPEASPARKASSLPRRVSTQSEPLPHFP